MSNYEPMGFQVAATQQQQQQIQQQQMLHERKRGRRDHHLQRGTLKQFVLDDLKLFVSPVTVVVDEFWRQIKR